MPTPLWTIPNILTLSRLPLSAVIFAGIEYRWYWLAVAAFAIAAITDWLDGKLARKWNQLSAFGRAADPLIDKVMILGGYVFLMAQPESGLTAWMVARLHGNPGRSLRGRPFR
jgi:CDP-diacylglycerol---glycerol-3-phosphate 3-phosphatidyltransferase